MTYSIVARNETTGEIGVAVASRFFACGAQVPWVSATAAIASQAFANPLWGVEGLMRLDGGEAPAAVLADFRERDAGQASRQAHFLAPDGRMVQHTGAACVPWAGHVAAPGVSVAGNMLTGPDVVRDTLASYLDHADTPFPERLLTAMEAGEAAGGDKRGRQAAGLVIHAGQAYPYLDIRADDHADPLAELRRLLAVSKERYLLFAQSMATAENFSGVTDRGPLDEAIADEETRRADLGVASRSFAVPPT
ncbi:MAG: DUF1028 domain-containing protein [Pseudomonadota bacterium]